MLYKFDGRQPVLGRNSYISDIARVIGDVVIKDNCYIGIGVNSFILIWLKNI
jgi:carbonic anhydrase/acetyltransferase-like protein (isoleucine patch superfamily)